MSKKKILLVDDERDILAVIGQRIESWGYDLITARNGREALDAVMSKNPDIVVLDYLMPGIDGIKTLQGIRKIDNDLPVVMFTAYPDERSIKGTEELGVSAYIPKLSVYADASGLLRSILNMIKKKSK